MFEQKHIFLSNSLAPKALQKMWNRLSSNLIQLHGHTFHYRTVDGGDPKG